MYVRYAICRQTRFRDLQSEVSGLLLIPPMLAKSKNDPCDCGGEIGRKETCRDSEKLSAQYIINQYAPVKNLDSWKATTANDRG